MNRKASKQRRKFVNQMRQMGDVPWPARAHKIAPTLTATTPMGGPTCERFIAIDVKRDGKLLGLFRRAKAEYILCGAPLELVPFKRLLRCPMCHRREEATAKDLVRMGNRRPSRRKLRDLHDGLTVKLIKDATAKVPWTVQGAVQRKSLRASQRLGRVFSRRKV